MFHRCDFLLGDSESIVIVIPERIPKDLPLSVELQAEGFRLFSGDELLGDIACSQPIVLQRLHSRASVGLVEFSPEDAVFPMYISAVAHVLAQPVQQAA